jgi:hypothetical protein
MPKVRSFEERERTKAVNISTTLPKHIYDEIKASKMSFNGVLMEGWANRNNFEGMKERQRETEQSLIKLQRVMDRLQNIVYERDDENALLKKRIAELENKKK